MTITVNGQSKAVDEGRTIADLIRDLGLSGQPCAAEVNREVVPRRQHAEQVLREGDAVELVTLVGGG